MQNQARHLQNIEIITQFKKGRVANETLKTYTGWGGLRETIYTPEVYKELSQVLTLGEIHLAHARWAGNCQKAGSERWAQPENDRQQDWIGQKIVDQRRPAA